MQAAIRDSDSTFPAFFVRAPFGFYLDANRSLFAASV